MFYRLNPDHSITEIHDVVEWALDFQKLKPLAVDVINGRTVSTIFMGVHVSRFNAPPLVFETMVFGPDDEPLSQTRYSTYDRAMEGHDEIIADLISKPPSPSRTSD